MYSFFGFVVVFWAIVVSFKFWAILWTRQFKEEGNIFLSVCPHVCLFSTFFVQFANCKFECLQALSRWVYFGVYSHKWVRDQPSVLERRMSPIPISSHCPSWVVMLMPTAAMIIMLVFWLRLKCSDTMQDEMCKGCLWGMEGCVVHSLYRTVSDAMGLLPDT